MHGIRVQSLLWCVLLMLTLYNLICHLHPITISLGHRCCTNMLSAPLSQHEWHPSNNTCMAAPEMHDDISDALLTLAISCFELATWWQIHHKHTINISNSITPLLTLCCAVLCCSFVHGCRGASSKAWFQDCPQLWSYFFCAPHHLFWYRSELVMMYNTRASSTPPSFKHIAGLLSGDNRGSWCAAMQLPSPKSQQNHLLCTTWQIFVVSRRQGTIKMLKLGNSSCFLCKVIMHIFQNTTINSVNGQHPDITSNVALPRHQYFQKLCSMLRIYCIIFSIMLHLVSREWWCKIQTNTQFKLHALVFVCLSVCVHTGRWNNWGCALFAEHRHVKALQQGDGHGEMHHSIEM